MEYMYKMQLKYCSFGVKQQSFTHTLKKETRAKNDNKNVDIKFSVHDRLTLKVKRLENQILKKSLG